MLESLGYGEAPARRRRPDSLQHLLDPGEAMDNRLLGHLGEAKR